jgi:hypothetical protein
MSLDVSNNKDLYVFCCSNNQLTGLNMKNGNNTNFVDIHYGNFIATSNPNLTCIQVDSVAYMNSNWASAKDATASYSQNCSSTGVSNLNSDCEIIIYPNPSSGIFTINLRNFRDIKVSVYDILGKCLKKKNCQGETSYEIDLGSQPQGIYFMEIVSDNKRAVKKLVLQ